MTRANRRTCNLWSQHSRKEYGPHAGYCEQCGSRTVKKTHGLYVCTECGLEQTFHHKD